MMIQLGAIAMVAVGFLGIFVLIVRDYKKNPSAGKLMLIKGCVLIGIALSLLLLLAISVLFPLRAAKTLAPIGGEVELLLYQVPQEQEVVKVRSFEI